MSAQKKHRMRAAMSGPRAVHIPPAERRLWPLALGAIGIVYGDLGTSPLYAFRECFQGGHGVAATEAHVLGVLSLIIWSLIAVISLKYVTLVLCLDNEGEGGILALMALVSPPGDATRTGRRLLVPLGLFGAALLYGDGMITPAISVLSAVEGLEVATPALRPYVVPATVGILLALFGIQKRGTARIGAIFGPILLVWFVAIAALGVSAVVRAPSVLAALDPRHGARFLAEGGFEAFAVLGAVVLALTGAEALYADLGHFGRRPIRAAWFAVVLPALLLNYLGQGALLLEGPTEAALANPFFGLVPGWGLYPMVALASAATVIASQAVISGAFSLTRQAVQLGYLPRLEIRHTSADEIGQIYIPAVNAALLLATVGLVLAFGRSTDLAGAYGIAVTSTMAITIVLAFVALRRLWRWPLPLAAAVALVFLAADAAFLGANALKIAQGGWFPLAVGLLILTVLTTWRRGREILRERLAERLLSLEGFRREIEGQGPGRVRGTAIYLTGAPHGVPPALVKNVRANRVLHERIVLLRVETERVPYVPRARRAEVERVAEGLFRVTLRYGFMQGPDVPGALEDLTAGGLEIDLADATYVLGRETLVPTDRPGMALFRERLFAFLSRNSHRATAFFRIPPERVLEIGVEVEL